MSRPQASPSGARQQRSQPHAPSGSQTTTETPSQPQPQQQTSRVLRLRGARNTNGRSVQWAEDVVDNEGLGRKSSKVCCIYHRPKAVDESSDESSSDSDVSTGDEGDGGGDGKGKGHECSGPAHSHERGRKRGKGQAERAPSPNAYEKVPKVKPKEGSENKG